MKSHKFGKTIKQMKFFTYSFFALAVLFLGSCKEQKKQSPNDSDKTILPYSIGKISNLYVYTDQSFQTSPLKDSVLYHLNQPYLLTPNLSPAVDITNYDFQQFVNGDARTANNLFIVNLKEESALQDYVTQILGQEQIQNVLKNKEFAMVKVNDMNASPQQVFFLLVNGFPNLSSKENQRKVEDFAQRIIESSTELDNTRISTSFSDKRNYDLEKIILEKFGVNIWIPRTYEKVLEDENFLWIIYETNELYSNLVFYKTDRKEEVELGQQVIEIRDEFGKKITSDREDSRMSTNVKFKPYPIQRELTVDEQPVLETRGLWKMMNDKMGGGFVNYTFESGDGKVTSIDGFVYYTEEKKRRKMRDIDAILSTIQFPSKQ